ncbi:peroxiredoxin family protein [Nocardia flavorosea]|uniref:peroxiredoxin family protein n=1 Tax=Nocardia flavorosea TaxID=53429 RepID=UPI00245810A1|nr:redoxin domain-containing protein [Nocardia flavorosea]
MLISGSPAPDLELEDTTGQAWRLFQHRGVHNVLLYFMRSTSCPLCNRHVRDLAARQDRFDEDNIHVAVVAPEGRSPALAWKTERGIPFPVLSGAAASPHESIGLTRKVFGALQQSGTVLVDLDGIVRHAHGATLPLNSHDRKGLLAAIDSVLGRPIG